MRVAFFGLPLAALALRIDGHEVVWAGLSRARAVGTRRLRRLVGRERVELVGDANDPRVLEQVRDARPDLVASWFFTKKLPSAILRLAPAFGVHPSLLPRHRGPDPYFWAIDSGDSTTGVTAHLLEEEYDTGAILGQRTLHIEPMWDSWRLARALDRPSLALFREVVRSFAAGTPPRARPQDEASATPAPEPSDEELALRWSWPAEQVERRVRAAAPWPGAWTEIGERIVTLVRVRQTTVFPRALAPGEAAVRPDGVAVVRAQDGAVELLAGRDEDDRPLSSDDLSACIAEARTLSVAPEVGLRFDEPESG
ncbi:MAG TPA: formyltransferase family protein [Polyangiaceae bacterium]|jgi:methionyl-tRNA formyltransferase